MIHVEKKVEKNVVEKEVNQTVIEPTKVEKPVKKETSKKVNTLVKKHVPKKEPEIVDKFNGLHAYALVVKTTDKVAPNIQQNAIVTARTEETAKNRVQKEYPSLQIVSIKRIPNEKGHEILTRVHNKAGVFFDENGHTLLKK